MMCFRSVQFADHMYDEPADPRGAPACRPYADTPKGAGGRAARDPARLANCEWNLRSYRVLAN